MLDGEYDRQLVNNKWNIGTEEVDARMMDDEGRQAAAGNSRSTPRRPAGGKIDKISSIKSHCHK